MGGSLTQNSAVCGGGSAKTWTDYKGWRAPPSTPAALWLARGRGGDVQWPHAAERKLLIADLMTGPPEEWGDDATGSGTGTPAQGGGPAETCGPGLRSAELWPKEQGVGGCCSCNRGKGLLWEFPQLKGNEFRGPEGVWEGAPEGRGGEGGRGVFAPPPPTLPSLSHLPHPCLCPIFRPCGPRW